MMTPAQCRAARGLLQWSQDQLANAAEVGVVTVRQFETEKAEPRRATLAAIQRTLEDFGVRFTEREVEANGMTAIERGVTLLPSMDGWIIDLARKRLWRPGTSIGYALYELEEGGYAGASISGVDPETDDPLLQARLARAALDKHLAS